MAINHRKGFKSIEEAERSKAFRMTPGATVETGCACGQVHVNMMGSAMSADRPPADQVHPGRDHRYTVCDPAVDPPSLWPTTEDPPDAPPEAAS
jgi:hypothetical protein